MKFIIRFLALACFAVAVPAVQTGCTTTPSTQNVAVQTLKAVGQTAETAMATTTHLWDTRAITAAQTNQVRDLYDKFQNAFRFAVSAVKGDTSQIASPDLITMAGELATLVNSFKKTNP